VKEVSPQTKVVLYTCPLGVGYGRYSQYSQYVKGTVSQLQQKWKDNLYVLDLFNAKYVSVSSYMQSDSLHPTKEGYAQVFTPLYIQLLNKIL
jgi:lysophospholipase L1-like esterase